MSRKNTSEENIKQKNNRTISVAIEVDSDEDIEFLRNNKLFFKSKKCSPVNGRLYKVILTTVKPQGQILNIYTGPFMYQKQAPENRDWLNGNCSI